MKSMASTTECKRMQGKINNYHVIAVNKPVEMMERLISCTNMMKRKSQSSIEYTLDQALQRIEYACMEEYKGRFEDAIKYWMEAGTMLFHVAQKEKSIKLRHLLLQKGNDIVEWAKELMKWIQENKRCFRPLRIVKGIAMNANYDRRYYTKYHELEPNEANLMVYTPICCIPQEFTNEGYRLQCIQSERRPRIMVVITMYNESQKELQATLRKVCNNMLYLQDHGLPGYEGRDLWKDLILVIVSDGREKANKGTLKYLEHVGLYDEDAINIMATGEQVKCHLFEHTLQLQKNDTTSFPPLQTAFALKEHNAGKLDSHLWYFEAFAQQIMPEYTFLLDVGTMPAKSAFRKLLMALETNPKIGGVCGEIAVDKPLHDKSNWVVAAQHFEYKISNIFDKPLESCFGFISVLPGAFSAYRYQAIRGAPLQAYFKSLTTPIDELKPFEANMYLAEDRILCFELIARKNCNWTLHYVKDAIARTDVPMNLIDLVGQRRRWLNGSFFATLFALWNWRRVYYDTTHSFPRKMILLAQFVYNALQIVFSWFCPANFYLSLYFVIFQGFQDNRWNFTNTSMFPRQLLDGLPMAFNIFYAIAIFTQVTIGLGNKPKHVKATHCIISALLGILMLTASITAIVIFMTADKSFQSIVLAILIFGTFFIGSAIHGQIHHIVTTFVQYTALMPTFINILMVYSFCNLHDLSWGTKGIENPTHFNPSGTYNDMVTQQKAKELYETQIAKSKDKLQQRFDAFRSGLLLAWVLSNMAIVISCTKYIGADLYLPIFYTCIAIFNGIRLFGCICYLFSSCQTSSSKRIHPIECFEQEEIITPYVALV
ncbi:chitin synthase (Chitin-UDP-GlcNac-transferase) [Thraustotheca clavata]|uniref:chitin synthase n=1 Tax=Thraustotheca clavata TaxID=74557 RepID=A0A1V9YRU2_9STRA|nr:chitin synthase (Chitin-UDP-GlcNac-transferase) [Thraustotheca clavata]